MPWPGGVTRPRVPAVLTVLRAFPCRSRLGDAEAAGAVEEEVRGCCSLGSGQGALEGLEPRSVPPRSARACSCGGCRWWVGTTATPSGPRCRPCTTSMHRWIISSNCRAAATASSPAWGSSAVRAHCPRLPGGGGCCHPPVPAPSVPIGPFYHGNPGVESKIAPFWVMPPPEVSGAGFGVGSPPSALGCPQGGVRCQSCGVTPAWLPHPPATAQ